MDLPPNDPYSVLDVAIDATVQEIRTVFREKVRNCHPDKFPDKKDEYSGLVAAYKILSNDYRRQQYHDLVDARTISIRHGFEEQRKRRYEEQHPGRYEEQYPASDSGSDSGSDFDADSDGYEDYLDHPRLARELEGIRKHQPQQSRTWEIPGLLQGVAISAFPDNGSEGEFLSLSFARKLNIHIITSSPHSFQLPNGTSIASVGQALLSFQFENERNVYNRLFHILPKLTHDVILGSDFLRITETLARHRHRTKEKILSNPCMLQLTLVGSTKQRCVGLLGRGQNMFAVCAVPDTGSSIMVISENYATTCQFPITSGAEYQTLVEFADGSIAKTVGMAIGLEWRFGSQKNGTYCDFHVLRELRYDVVLSGEFLYDTKAYTVYETRFGKVIGDNQTSELSFMREITFIDRLRRRWQNVRQTPERRSDDQNLSERERYREALRWELRRQESEDERIDSLPAGQQQTEREAENRRRQAWEREQARLRDYAEFWESELAGERAFNSSESCRERAS